MGSIERNIAKQAVRAGEPLPDRIANAPELKQGLRLYLDAFFDLDTERSPTMGLTSIPWSKIKTYGEFWKFDREQMEDLFYFIRRMDDAHLARLKEKNG